MGITGSLCRALRGRRLVRVAPLIGTVLAVSLISACGSQPTAATSNGKTTVKYMMVGKSATSWPLYVAEDKGMFSAAGISFQPVSAQTSPSVAQGLIAGAANMGAAGLPDFIRPIGQGAQIDVVANGVARSPYSLMAKTGTKAWSDLTGATVAVDDAQGVGKYYFEAAAKKHGLDPSDVKYIYIGSTGDRFAALSSGSVVATILGPPFTAQAESSGAVNLGNLAADLPNDPFQAIGVSRRWASANPQAVRNFFSAYVKAVRWINDPANKEEASKILAKDTGTSLASSEQSYDFYVSKIHAFSNDPTLSDSALDTFVGALKSGGFIKGSVPPASQWANMTYLPSA
jgi:NitT/TauT family transport system substrate-binding protein